MSHSPALEAAYQATTYRVELPGQTLALRVGQAEPQLDAWLRQEGGACWAIITAWNPESRPLGLTENSRRQEKLRQMLLDWGYRFFPAENRSDSGVWPPEPSFFVLGIPREKALELAGGWAQNAILWGGIAKIPQLLWI